MPASTPHTCPDCCIELQPIVIIDRSRLNELVSHDGQLAYASPEAKPSFWTREIPAAGNVAGFACPQCGRILLYAQPHTTK